MRSGCPYYKSLVCILQKLWKSMASCSLMLVLLINFMFITLAPFVQDEVTAPVAKLNRETDAPPLVPCTGCDTMTCIPFES